MVFRCQNPFHWFGPRWLTWCMQGGDALVPACDHCSIFWIELLLFIHCVLYLAVLVRLLSPFLSRQGPPSFLESLELLFSSGSRTAAILDKQDQQGLLSESAGDVLKLMLQSKSASCRYLRNPRASQMVLGTQVCWAAVCSWCLQPTAECQLLN